MGKAILVINMPDSCEECFAFSGYNCMIPEERGHRYGKKPPKCPLKDVPEKKESEKWEEDMKNRGWNECIDTILRR